MAIIPRVHDFAHGNTVNIPQLASAGGIWGCYIKATQGLGFTDPLYASRAAAILKAGMLLGAYDFSTGDDVKANVARFLSVTAAVPPGFHMLDFEDLAHNAMSGDQAYEFLDRLQQATQRPAVIYGGNRIQEHIDPQQSKWIDMAKTVRLVRCRYIAGEPADNAALLKIITPIAPWTSCFMVQYAADGDGPQPHQVPGSEPKADLNVVPYDTKEELAAAWTGTAPAVAPAMAGEA